LRPPIPAVVAHVSAYALPSRGTTLRPNDRFQGQIKWNWNLFRRSSQQPNRESFWSPDSPNGSDSVAVPAGPPIFPPLLRGGCCSEPPLEPLIPQSSVDGQSPDSRRGLSRWRGERFACTSLVRRWCLERLTVARHDDLNMESDVSSISMSINNGILAQLLSIQQPQTKVDSNPIASRVRQQAPAASFWPPHRKRLGLASLQLDVSCPRRFRSRLAAIRDLLRFHSDKPAESRFFRRTPAPGMNWRVTPLAMCATLKRDSCQTRHTWLSLAELECL